MTETNNINNGFSIFQNILQMVNALLHAKEPVADTPFPNQVLTTPSGVENL